ncbi:Uncharacterized mitochondrial protein AtMg00310 [Linum grandiflorum]
MNVFLLLLTLTKELERRMNLFWWGTKATGGKGIAWMRWERLCVKKDDGGMGFKDLHAYNMAMVGKQGWKLMNSPNALVTRIFKAKYFPRGDFLSAPVGGSPSYAWRSIWGTQELLRRGYRWRIGDEASIGVWHEPWLREEDRSQIASPVIPGLENLTVSDLWIPEMRLWDEEMLEELFEPADVTAIQNIPISIGGGVDQRIWNWSKRGDYKVSL